MTSMNAARLKMITTVIKLYIENTARFNIIPMIETLFTVIISLKNSIDAELDDTLQKTNTTTENRKIVQAELALAVFNLSNPLRSYASSMGDIILRKTAQRSFEQLNRLKMLDVQPVCSSIIKKADELKTTLAPFGLTEDMITTANQKLGMWDEWQSATKLKQGAISVSIVDVDKAIRDIVKLMEEQLDPIVQVIPNDKDLVDRYHLARKVDHPARTRTQLLFQIMQRNPNGELVPVYQADIVTRLTFIDNQGVTRQAEHRGKTDVNGEVSFRPVRYGFYDWEVTKAGFGGAVGVQERVTQGKINRMEVELVAEG